jgi:hypothetical protein
MYANYVNAKTGPIHAPIATALTLRLVASQIDGIAFLLGSEEFKAASLEPGTFTCTTPPMAEGAVVDCLG